MKFAFISFLFLINTAISSELQILHTNDLHGYFEGLNDKENSGSFSALKSKIDFHRMESYKKNIPSLLFDSGDFMEGNLYYKAADGEFNILMMKKLGFDAIALGNHDFLMGEEHLNNLLYKNSLPLVSSNFIFLDKYTSIKENILPYRIYSVSGKKIAVIGGTTNEKFYSWLVPNTKTLSPIEEINKTAKKLRKQNIDIIIALTHIGLPQDKKLVTSSSEIDLVVGGHTHTTLNRPVYMKNKKSKLIPIVQAGEHGRFLGNLVFNLDTKKVSSYELIPIKKSDGGNKEIEELIIKAKHNLEEIFGFGFLDKVIGETKISLLSRGQRESFWEVYFTLSMQEHLNADIGINAFEFFGSTQHSGLITRRKIRQFYPRFFELEGNTDGWYPYRVEIKGKWVKRLISLVVKYYAPMIITGLDFDLKTFFNNGKKIYKIENILFKGAPLNDNAIYSMAIPEGIFRGITKVLPITKKIVKNSKKAELNIWEVVEEKILKKPVVEESDLEFINYNVLDSLTYTEKD